MSFLPNEKTALFKNGGTPAVLLRVRLPRAVDAENADMINSFYGKIISSLFDVAKQLASSVSPKRLCTVSVNYEISEKTARRGILGRKKRAILVERKVTVTDEGGKRRERVFSDLFDYASGLPIG